MVNSVRSPEQLELPLEVTEEEVRKRRHSCWTKIAVAAVLAGFITFVIVDSQTNKYVRAGIKTFLQWIEENPGAGVVAFILVYFVATIVFIPGSILTLGAGFVFSASFGSLGVGILLGTMSVFIGASGGAIVSFLLGRYLFRDSVGKLSKKYSVFEALDKGLAEKGLRIMVLLRLSPIIPFNAINYVAAVTAISFRSYVLAMFAIIPGTLLYVFLGASTGSIADSASGGDNLTVTIVVVVVGLIFGVIAVGLTSYYARKELNKIVADRQGEIEVEQQPQDAES
ncbi:SNARE associated golgi protein [Nitzschia inconspicua]|uniref:SNARE associated golgi protein n=1 Tax=Nitzschia inconspicua TaxID=303405 RepID=A0A9K3PN16_9STRA|nr:SNARE associated golgi protein [Nitzschia inconspicua]